MPPLPAEDVDCSTCIQTPEISGGAVTTGKIAPGAVTGAKLAPDAVAKDKIQDGAVTKNKIRDDAVTNNKIKDAAVTRQKLKQNAVSTGKIKDGAVTVDKVSPELSNSIDTYCGPGDYVIGKDETGNYVCEAVAADLVYYVGFSDADDGSDDSYIMGSCDEGYVIDAVGCDCGAREEELHAQIILEPEARNSGVLYTCQMTDYNEAEAGCYDWNYDPMLGPSEANLVIKCVAEEIPELEIFLEGAP
jgi:hypothetical protein